MVVGLPLPSSGEADTAATSGMVVGLPLPSRGEADTTATSEMVVGLPLPSSGEADTTATSEMVVGLPIPSRGEADTVDRFRNVVGTPSTRGGERVGVRGTCEPSGMRRLTPVGWAEVRPPDGFALSAAPRGLRGRAAVGAWGGACSAADLCGHVFAGAQPESGGAVWHFVGGDGRGA